MAYIGLQHMNGQGTGSLLAIGILDRLHWPGDDNPGSVFPEVKLSFAGLTMSVIDV